MRKITILTCKKYLELDTSVPYEANIQLEYNLLKDALVSKGVSVERTNWDNTDYNFAKTDAIVFRTIWDYFERYEEFSVWLEKVSKLTTVINPLSLIQWNIDKHYLADLSDKGVSVMESVFINTGEHQSLNAICLKKGWDDIVIKPAISGAAMHTYKIMASEISKNEALFRKLVDERDMLVQEFQPTIMTKGETSLMIFNGKFTHAILKRTKEGEFRVQDDFGGTVHAYEPNSNEIELAEKAFAVCDPKPAYGRADIVWDTEGNPMISELEIIEPELWVRTYPNSAFDFAEGILSFVK
ncbi:ATP-grasp domain-containing protein [Patiriisocius marinus]|uniref:Prokaryotic glutathione synthetase ATP-binding domain-containing protein n=1 Tax=Patiriisocius marinus TaxID=1397112 RepID=A0A5J4IZN4_9FLAO|nr:hypothetical protein [Patiriisocius marinus]GER60436.1 hypothetical protein ULMA_25440 [Patiriisocius marinus]